MGLVYLIQLSLLRDIHPDRLGVYVDRQEGFKFNKFRRGSGGKEIEGVRQADAKELAGFDA